MSLFMMWKNQQVSNSGSRENNKAPSFFLGALNLFNLRREQDSNLRTGFAGYTLSRRASSTTRAPLQKILCSRKIAFAAAKVRKNMRITKNNLCFLITEHQTIAKLIDNDGL